MISYGIMQGRLTEPKGRGIQFFPFDNWDNEFRVAAEIGLNEIEFIFDYDNYIYNPLWTETGRNKLKNLMESTGVKVHAICFDYFMRRAFYRADVSSQAVLREENATIMKSVLNAMYELNIPLIEIPLVDDSSLRSYENKAQFREFILEIADGAEQNISFGLETDLPPQEFLDYLNWIGRENIGANYDSGNSSGLGYDMYEEVTTLREKILNIHIKDRKFQGTTVALGTGSADFEGLFRGLREIAYCGAYILQAARGVEGKERENIEDQLMFLKSYTEPGEGDAGDK